MVSVFLRDDASVTVSDTMSSLRGYVAVLDKCFFVLIDQVHIAAIQHSVFKDSISSFMYNCYASVVRSLNRTLKSSCFTNQALCSFHSFAGSSSVTSNLLKNDGTNL